MGHMGHGSRGSWVVGRVTWVTGHVGHGSRGSWVSSLMGQMGYGSQNMTHCQLCHEAGEHWNRTVPSAIKLFTRLVLA